VDKNLKVGSKVVLVLNPVVPHFKIEICAAGKSGKKTRHLFPVWVIGFYEVSL